MRLTVGPLPAAVYWRRRAVVLVGLAMVVLVISYACGGAAGPPAGADAGTAPTGDGSPTVPAPTVQTASPATPTETAFVLPVPTVTGACADDEIQIAAAAATAQVQRGQPVEVTMRIKNVSGRTCSRDVGADVQELSLADSTGIVWSSDDCAPRRGSDVRSFAPGKELSFASTWNGRRSRTGTGAVNCDAGAPSVGVYQLMARLDKAVSTPFALRID